MMFELIVTNSNGVAIDQFVVSYESALAYLKSIVNVYGDDVSVKISKYID